MRARLGKRVVEDLLRAGPAATRKALCEDSTLASFLDPAGFARLAEYAKPKPPPMARMKPGVDVLKVMAPRRSAWGVIARFVVQVFIIAAFVWLTYRGVLRIAR